MHTQAHVFLYQHYFIQQMLIRNNKPHWFALYLISSLSSIFILLTLYWQLFKSFKGESQDSSQNYLCIHCSVCTAAVHLLVFPWHLFGALIPFFLLSAIHFKVGCGKKVRSIDCLIYSHRVCTPWAVKLQNSNPGNTETLKTFREHICPHTAYTHHSFPFHLCCLFVHVCTKMCEFVFHAWGLCFVWEKPPAHTCIT